MVVFHHASFFFLPSSFLQRCVVCLYQWSLGRPPRPLPRQGTTRRWRGGHLGDRLFELLLLVLDASKYSIHSFPLMYQCRWNIVSWCSADTDGIDSLTLLSTHHLAYLFCQHLLQAVSDDLPSFIHVVNSSGIKSSLRQLCFQCIKKCFILGLLNQTAWQMLVGSGLRIDNLLCLRMKLQSLLAFWFWKGLRQFHRLSNMRQFHR